MASYTLRGDWPNGATSTHESTSLADLRFLAANWAEAGATVAILSGSDVIERGAA